MNEGTIFKALSGFYYVKNGDKIIQCRAKGKFRHDGLSPLVGDYVFYTDDGIISEIRTRKNSFIRPAVANVDVFVYVASEAKPVTDPFLIDRVSVIASNSHCDFILAINKIDLDNSSRLYDIYHSSGFEVFNISAENGNGIDDFTARLKGNISVLTGNSGVGKSSIINSIIPGIHIETDQISEKLGRGKHTTRHIELYSVDNSTFIADTPGFASFDIEMINNISADDLQYDFVEFEPYLGTCRFNDCRHLAEPGCGVRPNINKSRHESYSRLYDIISNHKPWD